MIRVSRRDFLRLSGLALAGAMLPPTPPEEAPRQVQGLGRAVRTISTYDRPSLQATPRLLMAADTIFNIYSTALSDDDYYNRVWYETSGGYVYSGHVQPVKWELQTPLAQVPAEGFLGEVTVPFAQSLTYSESKAKIGQRFYYATTHWVTGAQADAAGVIWYKLFDELTKTDVWVKGEYLRRVLPEEVTPLAPYVADKRIEIGLEKQTFQCFESGRKVLDVLCSTGVYLRTEQGKRIFGTPGETLSRTSKE